MINVTLTGINGERYHLDTPDPALIGPWLMEMFRDAKGSRAGFKWTLEIYGEGRK